MRWNEEVARKEKVCPMTLRIGDDDQPRSLKCYGSECMAWRGSLPEPGSFRLVTEGLKKVGRVELEIEPPVQAPESSSKGGGFCGLAGPPE